ncbi:FAD dependent oxidoreductase-domain-containing protein [Suillus fuscotomentosus]|uniref:FAD dependent oxidoreductase-domain-containing protein n=1 Tax=Suillus fuscotomentosus TaxID=1912939 RepID=A0AAD4HK53_9AGAM|nr:FAD dependent oxidoreductase-domain-containing protein [Suillus fuscotomentosus]KAG1899126.1 FAD dependent oxidoreductase-domain-containing protein [Suillus fuscotomentosus]
MPPVHPQILGKLEHSQKVLETTPSGHPTPAKLPSRNPTRSFWIDSSPDANPLAGQGSQDPLPSEADICIIGAGFTGCRRRKRTFTGRNGGHLTPAAFTRFAQRQALFDTVEAIKSYELEQHTTSLLVKIIEENGWASDVDLVEGGHISLLFTEKEAKNAHNDFDMARQAQLNLDGVEWLSKEELEKEYGVPYPGFRRPGYNVWPLKLVTKLYQHAQAHARQYASLSLHTRTPVTAVTHETTSTYTVVTNWGSISCSRIVHATNGYASHLLPFLASPDGIIPARGQVMTTRASVGTDQIKISSWSGNKGFAYWFPRPVTRDTEKPLIIIGGGQEAAAPSRELYVDDDSETHPLVGKALREFLPSVFEGKYDPHSEPEMEWTGITGYTKTGDPFVRPNLLAANPDRDLYKKQYIAAGYTGHGMPRAFGCAEVIAQMILAEISDKEWKEPDWLPQRYLTWNRRVE